MGGVSVVHWLVLLLAAVVVGLVVLLVRGRGRDLTAPPPAVRRVATADEPQPPLPTDLETRLWVLLRDGEKIQAVKMVRDELGLDLRRSKQVVDEVEERLPRGVS